LVALAWLYDGYLGEDSIVRADLRDSLLQGAKERIEGNLKPKMGRSADEAGVGKNSNEAVAGHSLAPEGRSPSTTPTVGPAGTDGIGVVQEAPPSDPPGYVYRADGRRDPFLAIVQDANRAVEINLNVPPLQRVALSEISLIGIVWGGFGYLAMVQTPDGRGYTVREGTRIGSSEGLVSSITAEILTVKEPAVDVLGNKEMREHLIPLHPKVNVE